MTSKHRDRSSLKERGSVREGNPADDTEGVNIGVSSGSVFNGTMREGDTSQLIQTTGNNSQQSDRDRKRMIHNEVEKKRKEKIKYWISKIGEILPTITLKERETPSTLEIVEKAYQYIVELREKNEQLMQTRVDQEEGVSMLNMDIDWDGKKTGSKNDTSSAFLDSSGDNSTEIKSTNNGVSSTTDGTGSGSKEDTSKSKSKSKRRNTISVQLENLKNARSQQEKELQSQQELITSSVSVPEEMNIIGTAQMGGVHGNQFLGHHNMLYNPVMVTGNNQFMMPGGMQNSLQGNISHSLSSSVGNTFGNSGMSNEKASAETAGTGLLQLAMQDAGITPHSGGHGNHLGEGLSVSAPATPAPELTSEEEQIEGSSPQNSALQTLASVASKTQNMSMAGGMGSSSVPGMSSSQMIQSNALMTCTTQTISSNIPIMSTGHMPGYQQMIHAGNNVVNMQMSVPMNVLQNSGMSGPVQHQQIMFINEQGFPMIATVPVGVDVNNPSSANKVNNFSQQHLMKDQQNMDPNSMSNQAMVLAQQQANLLQNQMMGGSASQFQNMALQQQNMLLQQQQISGQFQGNQFIQSQGQGQGQFQGHFQLQGQHQFQVPGSSGQIPGIMQQNTNLVLPVNQNGSYLALNTMPNQPTQLPSALILPNGQIIPVVSNPQTLTSQTGIINANAQVQQRVGVQQQFQAQFQTGADGTLTQANSALMNPNQMIVGQGQTQGQIHIHSVQQGQGQPQSVHQSQIQDQQSMDILMTTSSANQKSSAASSSTTNAVSNSSVQNMVMTTQVKSSASQKADAFTAGNVHPDTSVTNMMGHGMRNVSSAQGIVTLPSGQISGTDNPGIQPQPVPPNQTSYQSQAIQQVPAKSTPILITLPVNGQPTSVLVDPTTMQVLGQFQPPVSTQSQIQTSVATSQTGIPSTPTTMPTTASTSSNSVNNKKNKKNNQRTICPKPTTGGSDGTKTSTGSSSSSKKKSKSSIRVDKESAEQPDSVSDGLHIEIPESTMEPDTSTHTTESTSSETDILAKAAESIFSSPNEISPTISGFYNPANEDNPLHIDTSAGETEDDGNASPQKQAMEVERDNNDGQGSNNKQGGNKPEKDSSSVGENNSSNIRNANSIASSSCDQGINNAGSAKEIVIGKLPDSMTDLFHESQAEDRTLEIHMDMTEDHFMEPAVTSACVEAKKNKKSKKPSTTSTALENQTKPKPEVQQMQDSKGKVTSKKQGTEEIIFPETITFSENELDDVLDRVESAVLDGADGFGTSLTDSCESPGTASKSSSGKKSKSKRSKTTADAEQEPPNKKPKQCKDKTNKMSDQTNVKHMSVYDFNGDASDDIGSPLLPLHLSKSSVAPDAPSMPLLVKSSGPEMVITAESNPHPQHSPSKSQTSSKKSSKSISNSQSKLQSEAGKGISNPQAKISSEPITSPPLSAPVLSSPKLNRSSAKMTTDNLNPVSTANESPKVTQSSTISYYPTPTDKRMASREQSSSSRIVSQTLESITGLNTVTNMDPNSSLLSLSMTSMSPTFSAIDDASPPHNSSKSSSNMQVNDTSPRSSLNTHTTPQNQNPVQPNSNNPLNQGMYDSPRDSSGIDSSNLSASQPTSNSLQSRNTQDSTQTKNNSGIPSSERGVTEPNTLKSPQASFGSPPQNFSSSAGELSSVTTNSLTLPSDYTMTTVAKEPLPASSNSNTFNRNNFSSPYSAEMLFNSPAKQGINVKSPHGQSTIATSAKDIRNKSNANSSMPEILKQQNKIYSAENFVHSSQNDILRNQPDTMRGDKRQSTNKQLRSVNTDTSDGSFARLQNESSSDAFNFANIGLNLTPIASSGSSYMDSLNLPGSAPVTVSTNSFSFSLSSATGTTKSTSSSVGHHPFSFYPMLSSVSQPSQFSPSIAMSQSQQPPQMSPGLFRHELTRGDNSHEVTNKPSCSKEKMPSSHGQSSMQEPFSFSMSRSNTSHEHMAHDQNFFSDSQRRQGIADANKNQSDQLRNTQKQLTDVSNSQSRNPSSSQTEKRNVTSMERTPQLHSSNQPYFSPTGFSSSQPMNTPPLHHPPLLSNEENRRTMTNRSPYDSNFTNPSNQGFSSLNLPYGGNRYEGGSMNFNRDSSGTQPLSHTPPNQSSAGRKSANPPPSSENTKSTKQPQSQLPMNPQQHPPVSQGPMSGPAAPSSSSRPTPPNPSLRHTPPQITPPQSVPANQQMPQPRQQKQSSSSRASKQQKKSNKQLYPEVDSNLSHSIFEPNRSMTPFFPLQNLSPQSRAVQGEGPPFLPGNFFNPGSRLANSNTPMPKTSDISFNQLFQPGRSQNGLGLNFQPGFGMNMNMNMNMNSVHGNHGNGPITPHSGSVGVTPHMGNFSLSNIFSDSASQSESLNISPIKFSHTNPILSHQPGMDPNSLQHHHQGSSLYHNRSHPPTPSMMSINSILGPNPHGFDGRSIGQINTSMAPPFHGHGNPAMFAMPPLNFSMHDH